MTLMIVASYADRDEAERAAALWSAGSGRVYVTFRHRATGRHLVLCKEMALSEPERRLLADCDEIQATQTVTPVSWSSSCSPPSR